MTSFQGGLAGGNTRPTRDNAYAGEQRFRFPLVTRIQRGNATATDVEESQKACGLRRRFRSASRSDRGMIDLPAPVPSTFSPPGIVAPRQE
jgi:hypothetical protein